ncbi:MAG: dynamin family protein [Synergistaceae bacterium]|nr:dynamin family protein [Synergistaceae bacterium]
MNFTTDLDEFEELHGALEDDSNQYLTNADRGLSLVADVVSGEGTPLSPLARGETGGSRRGVNFPIEDTIDAIFSSCGHVKVTDEAELSAKLKRLAERLKTPMRYKVLSGKTVIGVGGTYSAGKSSFLNSLLDDESALLPVDQNASTSVATYIMKGQSNIAACNIFGREVKLNSEALSAISHGFLRKHGLNLAQYLDFIAVQSASLAVDGVALLDTPGYDNGLDLKNLGDKARSQRALKSIDRLIWLHPAIKGTATDDDINFIKSLGEDLKVMLVVSKCDEQPEVYRASDPERSNTVQSIKNSLVDKGINICGVIPYTTQDTDWPRAKGCKQQVIEFLRKSSQAKKTVTDIKGEIDSAITSLRSDFHAALNELERQSDRLASDFDRAANPLDIPSVIRLYGVLGSQSANIKYDRELFERSVDVFSKWVKER